MTTEEQDKFFKSNCNKLAYGICTTLHCLKRGGWKRGANNEFIKPTCEYLELKEDLDSLREDRSYLSSENDYLRIYEKPYFND